MMNADTKVDEPFLPALHKTSTQIKELAEKAIKAAEDGKKNSRNKIKLNLAGLRLNDLQLHGREEDTKLLKSKLRALKADKNDGDDATTTRPGLLLVTGESGTGKSALVMHSLRDPAQKMGIVFAGGKFDINRTALPLSAFVQALSSFTKFVVANDSVRKLREDIQEEFGEDDIMLLSSAMVGCEDLFPIDKVSENANESILQVVGKEAVMRLQYAIRRLLKVICTNLKGVVLFIDDLQWSDTATLDLIKNISLDTAIPSLLLVGAYRNDEVAELHPLALHIRELEEQKSVAITTLKVSNLSISNVTSLVADAMRMEDNKNAVGSLATSIHKKTAGNVFFVLLFLRHLHDEGLIQYNIGAMKWMWDDNAVSSTMVTQNVATIMIDKLKSFEQDIQQILMVASCLGASFCTSIIAMVVETLSETESRCISDCNEIGLLVKSIADELEKDGLWERESEDVCHFSHDQIQSAAFKLIPSEERNSFRGKIGSALMKRLDPDSLEECLFEAVSLQNCALSSMSGDERIIQAKMNLRAGLKASKIASFETAIVYFKSGRELLRHSWEEDPDTMLQLCSEEANARYIANDDLGTMNLHIDDVMNQQIPVRDQFKVSMVKVKSAMAAGNLHESIDIALQFCRKLGLPALKNKPVSKLIILAEYIKTRRAIRNRTAEEIASLPELSDELIIMGREMMTPLGNALYLAQPTLGPIINFRLVRSSIKHGISRTSCVNFSVFGLILCGGVGKLKEGREMAKAAELLSNHDMKSYQILACEGFVIHWTAPIQATLTPLLDGYQIGLQTGDIDNAGLCLVMRSVHLFYAARPLESLQKEIGACVDILSQLSLESHRLCIVPYLLTAMKLRGVDVAEECMDYDAISKVATESSNLTGRALAIISQLELLVIMGTWDCALELLINAGNIREALIGGFTMIRITALDALISLKAAQTSALPVRIKWKRRGLKSMKLLRSWAKNGNINVVHTVHLLEAELAVLERKGKKAEENFKSAIKVAAQNGFLQDKALAHELMGSYCAAQGDDHWASYHIEKSQEAYSDWGANSKVVNNPRPGQDVVGTSF